jgi:hypothetical protein
VSSRFGIARSTADVDVVAELREAHAAPLEAALRVAYYVDLDAFRRRAMFTVVHLETMMKVDVYVLATAFDRETLSRATAGTFSDDGAARAFSLATAEDLVLHKLAWFHAGGDVSERQWSDVVGVLRVQAGRVDLAHMRRWAAAIGVSDLLERALAEAAA